MFGRVKAYRTPSGSVYTPFEVLAEQPHLLIGGCTGSGKSVTLNGIITTIITKYSPVNAQFILVDPKRVELCQYRKLPHCLQYASEPNDIINALTNAVSIMENRYRTMQQRGETEYSGGHIYVVIDELADIMTTNKKQFTPLLQRLAQLGRASHIHCLVCTQSVLVQILPSFIRCNFPVVIGLRTANAQQSRLLISDSGCELLPDPKSTGTGYALVRDGADLFKVKIYKYPDNVRNELIAYWTSNRCIA